MPATTQLRVAIEFGFPEKIVVRVLRRHKFDTAGDLVMHLEDHWEELKKEDESEEKPPSETEPPSEEKPPSETEPPAEKRDEEKPMAAEPQTRELTLREETEALYRNSICLVCWKRKRTHVTLPCSHFNVCDACEPTTRRCPLRTCGEAVECSIRTYCM